MKKFALILSIFLSFHPVFANNGSPAKEAPSKAGYAEAAIVNLLMALENAKKLHPKFTVPGIEKISGGVYLMLGARDLVKEINRDEDKDIVRTSPERLAAIGLTATMAAGNVVGYVVPGTGIANLLMGAGYATAYLPKMGALLEDALPGLQVSYDLDLFTTGEQSEETYLACSYKDPASGKGHKIWAEEDLISDNLKKELTKEELTKDLRFIQGSLLVRGKWILVKEAENKSHYVFGTTTDPRLLQAACIEAITNDADKRGIELVGDGMMQMSAGNTRWNNSYAIRFYKPTEIKEPGKKGVLKAILMVPEEAISIKPQIEK